MGATGPFLSTPDSERRGSFRVNASASYGGPASLRPTKHHRNRRQRALSSAIRRLLLAPKDPEVRRPTSQ